MEARTNERDEVVWTEPAVAGAIEWTGAPIGRSNTITRTKSRTAVHDKTLDADPVRRDALIGRAEAFAAERECFTHDVVIHGIRVRATTNLPHLIDFWRDNWFGVDEWTRETGRPVPAEPAVRVFALGPVPDEQEAAYYSRARNTIVFFNTSYYGQLKSWVLGAVGRILAEDFGIHSIHGAAVDAGGDHGILFIAPTGTGKSTSSYGLMRLPEAALHSDDWVFVRYAVRLRSNGTAVCPYQARLPGIRVRGFEALPFLRDTASRGAAVRGLTLDDRHWVFAREDIDWAAGLEAYAYISEKRFYLRSNLVESFPSAAAAILNSKLENVPDETPELLRRFGPVVQAAAAELDGTLGSHERVQAALARLVAFENARAMLDVSDVFGRERVFTNPLRPLRLTSVVLLRRDPEDPTVVRRLDEQQFIERLACGRTPQGKYETAYNAYRAVDDAEERRYIEQLVARGESLLELTSPDAPQTLREEFTLFRALFAAAACWDVNTILRSDPAVGSTREAVERTTNLLRRIAASDVPPVLTLSDYQPFAT